MSDFSKVTGSGDVATNENFLRKELTRLQRENAQLNLELVNRSMPIMGMICDALSQHTLQSQQGDANSRQILRRFIEIFDIARAESQKITIVKSNGSSQ